MLEILTLFAAVALVIISGLGALALTYAVYAAGHAFLYAMESMSGRMTAAFSRLDVTAEDRFRVSQVEDEIRAGSNPSGGRIDQRFVQAAQETKCISSALKVVKNSTATCCEVQKFLAQAQGVADMAEIQWDPLCVDLRQRVVDSMAVTVEHLQAHPNFLTDSRLLKQAVALRSLRQVCEECELMRYSVKDVPAMCSPAASIK